jgi:hypothetical protein
MRVSSPSSRLLAQWILTPADGRTPVLHLESWSLSRLNGCAADLISRCSRGEDGDVAEAVDIFRVVGC